MKSGGIIAMGTAREFAESLETDGTLVYAHPLTDRRVSVRQKQKYITQMTPWSPGHPSIPFDVVVEDVSESGAGVVHERACPIGMRHLLTVPRGDGERPIVREYNVIRCEQRTDGKFSIGLELIVGLTTDVATGAPPGERRRVTSDNLKLLFLAFGLVCLLVAFFVPL